MQSIPWSAGRWTHAPASVGQAGGDLMVTAVEGSDAWRVTSYGFIHATEHALVTDFGTSESIEVAFLCDYSEQFDQAGIFVRLDDLTWVKAGVEYADGVPQVGAVVTHGSSDWSVAPVPDWHGRVVRIRVSRSGDALTVRAGLDGGELRLVRVAPFPEGQQAQAGPYVCAPTRPGLTVRFTDWSTGPADSSLH